MPRLAVAEADSSRWSGADAFLREVVRSPAAMGAIAPTSRSAARHVAQVVPERYRGAVVELGAGTGAISAAIGARLGPEGRHLAVERDAEMLASVADAAPWAQRVHGDAADLERLLDQVGLDEVDVVVSSLPWSNFPGSLQEAILDQIVRVLTPGGVFTTIVYRPTRARVGSRRFHAALRERFDETVETRTIWGNMPPARLEVCRRPRRGDSQCSA